MKYHSRLCMISPKKYPSKAGLCNPEICCILCLEKEHTLKNIIIDIVANVANSLES